MSKLLTKEAILETDDLPKELMAVPEWGGDVYVRSMTGEERDDFEASLPHEGGRADLRNLRARLCARCICDDKGERLFADDDIDALGKKSAAALQRVFEVAQRLNALGAADMKDLEGQ